MKGYETVYLACETLSVEAISNTINELWPSKRILFMPTAFLNSTECEGYSIIVTETGDGSDVGRPEMGNRKLAKLLVKTDPA